ncbi:MAG: DUF5679 domain-containing protein [Candidatus Paceibacterota bacterium]
MATLTALCMKCKHDENAEQIQEMNNIEVTEKGGRYSARGECGNCGGNMFKFLSKDDAEKMESEGVTIKHVEVEE